MRHRITHAAACITAAAALVAPLATATQAQAAPALAAPGAPMRLLPINPPQTVPTEFGGEVNVPASAFIYTCSQGPTGTVKLADGTTRRVMLTASHCLNPIEEAAEFESIVRAPVGEDYIRIGEAGESVAFLPGAADLSDPIAAIRTADWGIVNIDEGVTDTNISQSRNFAGAQGEPATLTTVRDYRTLRPGEVSFDNFGQPICKDGATTGRSCGTQIGRTRDGVYSYGLRYRVGDSGGINYDPRDGAVIGVSSITLQSFGKAQPADRIIEDAFGVADGQVNDVFAVTDSSAERASFTTSGEERDRVEAEIEALNPDFEVPNPRVELDKAIASAQQDASRYADQALRGEVNLNEVRQAAEQHAAEISTWGQRTAGYELGQLLSR